MVSFHGKFVPLYMAMIFVKFNIFQEAATALGSKGYKVFRVTGIYIPVVKKDIHKNVHTTSKFPWYAYLLAAKAKIQLLLIKINDNKHLLVLAICQVLC